MATIDDLLDELQTHRAALELPLEGFRDYDRLNLTEAAKEIAVAGIDAYGTRRALTMAAIEALQALADSDYPALPRFTAPAGAKTDLNFNSASISAANAVVDVETAATHAEAEVTISDQ